jgi:hypothetical protein
MSTPTVGVGSIRLHDSAVPDLVAGTYRLRAGIDVDDVTHGTSLPSPPEGSGVVQAAAPRFVLDRTEVVSSHPPASGTGAFGDRLPHVALGRRTLPWERRSADGRPWLALLVLRADEADLAPGALRAGLGTAVIAALEAAEPIEGDPTVTLLRVHDLGVFRAVLPRREEVGLLTHLRQVNIADTALARGDDDGWFAVVTANRLPLAGPEGTEFVAVLVSLEGREDVFDVPDGSTPPPLVALLSWAFTSTGAGGTFERLLAEADAAPFGTPAAGMAPLTADGAVTLTRTLRDGTPATATYRGPLLGTASGPSSGESGDPGDVSLAAARELGRLLAAADGRFLREVVDWHRAADAAERTALVRDGLASALAALTAPAGPARGATAAPDAAADAAGYAAADAAADAAGVAPVAAGPAAALDARTLTAAVLGVVGDAHRRPADRWQVPPGAGRALAARRRAAGAQP